LIELSPAKWRDYRPVVYPAWHIKLTGYIGWFGVQSFRKLKALSFSTCNVQT